MNDSMTHIFIVCIHFFNLFSRFIFDTKIAHLFKLISLVMIHINFYTVMNSLHSMVCEERSKLFFLKFKISLIFKYWVSCMKYLCFVNTFRNRFILCFIESNVGTEHKLLKITSELTIVIEPLKNICIKWSL